MGLYRLLKTRMWHDTNTHTHTQTHRKSLLLSIIVHQNQSSLCSLFKKRYAESCKNRIQLICDKTLRTIRPEVFCKKGVLRNFAKFMGKHLCQSLFFNKVAVLKKRLWYRCFPINLWNFSNTFNREHLLETDSKHMTHFVSLNLSL